MYRTIGEELGEPVSDDSRHIYDLLDKGILAETREVVGEISTIVFGYLEVEMIDGGNYWPLDPKKRRIFYFKKARTALKQAIRTIEESE